MIKTICIAGKNNIAVNIAQYILKYYPSIRLIAVCNSNDVGSNSFQQSFRNFCKVHHIDIVLLKDLFNLEDFMFLSLEFDRIIKPDKFKAKNLFNIHFSLLPAYKGMYTSAIPILNNERYSGVTLHKIDDGIDTGDIISQYSFEIGAETTGEELYLKYIDQGTALIIENLQKLIDGSFNSIVQPSINASYYSKHAINYSNLSIDLNKTAQEIYNQIRAFAFREYQLPIINGVPIYHAVILPEKSSHKSGTILQEDDFFMTMATIDYNVKLKKDKRDLLLSAYSTANLELITWFKKNNYPLFQKNKFGWDTLIVSAYNGHFELTKELIDIYQGDVNTKNNNLTTLAMYAMTYASKTNDLRLLQYLCELKQIDFLNKDAYGKDIHYYAKELNNNNVINLLKCQ